MVSVHALTHVSVGKLLGAVCFIFLTLVLRIPSRPLSSWRPTSVRPLRGKKAGKNNKAEQAGGDRRAFGNAQFTIFYCSSAHFRCLTVPSELSFCFSYGSQIVDLFRLATLFTKQIFKESVSPTPQLSPSAASTSQRWTAHRCTCQSDRSAPMLSCRWTESL